MKSVKTVILIFFLTLFFLAFTLNYLHFKILKVIIDNNDVLLLEAISVNITIVYTHSYLLSEVREVYDIRNGQICIAEVIWPVGGAGAPASLNDLAHLKGDIMVDNGRYIVINAGYCLGKSLAIGTAFMNDWEVFINGYRITEGKEIRFELGEINGFQYIMAKIGFK